MTKKPYLLPGERFCAPCQMISSPGNPCPCDSNSSVLRGELTAQSELKLVPSEKPNCVQLMLSA
jgi:hypothetical protein